MAKAASDGIQELTPQEANEKLAEGIQYLDVRTPEEYSQGHPPGAVSVPVLLRSPVGMVMNGKFVEDVQEAFPDKSAQLVVGCLKGPRGVKAITIMEEQGYTNLYNVVGGYEAWIANNLPSEK